jgi:hypothetical protein
MVAACEDVDSWTTRRISKCIGGTRFLVVASQLGMLMGGWHSHLTGLCETIQRPDLHAVPITREETALPDRPRHEA